MTETQHNIRGTKELTINKITNKIWTKRGTGLVWMKVLKSLNKTLIRTDWEDKHFMFRLRLFSKLS